MFPFCACFFPPSFLDHLFPCLCSCSIQCEKVRDHFLILYFPPCVSILICVHWEAPIKLNWKKSGSKTRICLTKLSASLYQRLGHVQAPQMALLFCHETSGIWILCLCWHFFFSLQLTSIHCSYFKNVIDQDKTAKRYFVVS